MALKSPKWRGLNSRIPQASILYSESSTVKEVSSFLLCKINYKVACMVLEKSSMHGFELESLVLGFHFSIVGLLLPSRLWSFWHFAAGVYFVPKCILERCFYLEHNLNGVKI